MDIVFYRPGLGSVSPQISVPWKGSVVDLLNRLVPLGGLVHLGAYAEEACADFVVALAADPVTAQLCPRVEVLNLRLRWDRLDPLYPERAVDIPAWRDVLFAEIERLDANAKDANRKLVLIDMEPPFSVTRGGKLLCRMVNALIEPWKEGQPTWVVPLAEGKVLRTKRSK